MNYHDILTEFTESPIGAKSAHAIAHQSDLSLRTPQTMTVLTPQCGDYFLPLIFLETERKADMTFAPTLYEPCVILKPDMIQADETVRIDAFVKIEGGQGVCIGQYVHIASFCHFNAGGGKLIIGSHSGFASHVVITSGYPDFDGYTYVCPNEPPELVHVKRTTTTIGDYVVLFSGVLVLPGIHIHDGAIVGAGSVVTEDIPAWQVWAGNPAKFVRRRKVNLQK